MSIWAIVGGTGTFGREALRQLLAREDVTKVRIISRDEAKQAEVRASIGHAERSRVVFILGDVRDEERMRRAIDGAHYVLHAAALKRVEAVQADVEEAVRTNILGTLHVAKAAEAAGVRAAVLISSDKAADPVNAYGVTKLMGEHLFASVGRAWGARATRLVTVRYGNVWGSRGSVVESWARARVEGRPVELRDPDATRYFFPIERAVELALWAAIEGRNGYLYTPSLAAARMGDLAEAFEVEVKVGALLDAEKKHERMLTACEAERASMVPGRPGLRQVPPVTGLVASAHRDRVTGTTATSEVARRLSVGELRQAIAGEDVW